MTVERTDYTSLQFSTRALPASRRLPALRELFDRSVQLEIEADPDQPVEMEMTLAPGLRRARMLSSLTARMARPASMLADGEDTICLIMKTGGHMAIAQRRQESVPQAGDGVLLVYREPALLQFTESTYVSVRVPFAAISTLTENVGAAAALRIPRDVEALSLLRAYIASMPQRIADPRLGKLAAAHIYDLLSLAIGATREGREIANQRGVRAARLEAIKASLLGDATLDIDHLAARHGISPRYIQMLFEQTGTTFSEFVLERKLEAARSMLASPRYATWSIAEIALEAGFGDISNFNRRYKQRYQTTPSGSRTKI
ncbi:MAG: helix-turn-helix transcriptional regulator [Methylobacteriaceae bacterium]|nr:helix-turn-helix transcriptional regulator [Rhodoblastus sp.]MCC0005057.1 helix-turn-helix transcriptional regulator [Methylobacteriaceae bacterium]